MKQMMIYNTLSRKKEPFVPVHEGKVGIYSCGPTVYNYFHIGNARPFIIFDTLRRFLTHLGYDVTFVQNFTDIDDKMIKRAHEENTTVDAIAERYIAEYFKDADALGVQRADVHPRATKHIGEIIALIKRLEKNGLAYRAENGDVYFDTQAWRSNYGRLIGQDLDDLESGARIEVGDLKRHPMDFALWKAQKPGEPAWKSPWGDGRPGWHIECSAMSMKYLGETFDLHTGGIDNLFPHHENEIAQAEAATGKPFVKTWMHCAHLRVNGEKMSKSLGNFFTLRDLIEKGWSGREIRYVLINAHYRSGLNFAFSALEDARKALARIDACVEAATDGEAPEWARKHLEDFTAAVNDDLNLPKAFAALFALVRDANGKGAAGTLGVFKRMDEVLGVIFFGRAGKAAVPAEIQKLLDERAVARAAKNWAESDRLRDAIAAAGWLVKDSREGQSVTKK